MFYLYHHNDLNELAGLFSLLRERNPVAPLDTDTVLVPNHGMGRWLTIQLAETDGIVANVDTALPGKYIWQLLDTVNPGDKPRGKHFEPEGLPWHIYLALPDMADVIPSIQAYLGDPVDEVRRWQLARQLGNVFDKYLVYRGPMLAAWEDGETPAANPGQWQAQVWRYLTNDQRLGRDHRSAVLTDFVTRLSRDPIMQKRVVGYCPSALYCFGLVAVAPDQLRLLYALAAHIDVHFLLPNPSQEYWGDIVAGRMPLKLPEAEDSTQFLPFEAQLETRHPLLSAFGRMARDTLRVLYSDEFYGLIDPELGDVMPYTRPGPDSLLHRIQADIVTLDCSNPEQGLDESDTSFEIHACHSPLREVQVLQDQLLARLAADDERVTDGEISTEQRLAPRDIIVMLPDVAAYAPAIKAVFGGARHDRYLPFGLADRARSATHPIVSCFATLIDLPLSRWQASELLELLAVPAVMRRFGLSAGELDTVTRWIGKAGIRWGRDAPHRESLGAGHFEQNSWRFGLDRLLLGVAQADDQTLIDGVAPWSDLEGSDTAALGKLWRFERTLGWASEQLLESTTPGKWQALLNKVVDELISPAPDAPDEQRAVDSLRTVFSQFKDAEHCTAIKRGDGSVHADRNISWFAIREMLHTELDSASERQPFLAGGITFCGMVPLRAVPFRVVCILGLNDGAFPRDDTNRAFNVMYDNPHLGDRNTRDDDRLLFLQALTAARDAFYISHVGQDVHSGEALPPSPIVGETLEFIRSTYFRDWDKDAFDRRLIHKQPMQPFSLRYFSPDEADPRVFTYAGDWRDATRAAVGPRGQRAPFLDDSVAPHTERIETIDLNTLKRFFDHPAKAFFRDRLKLDLELDERTIENDEPLTLDALTASALRQRLFASADTTNELEVPLEPSALERARGQLPPAPLADVYYGDQAESVNALLPTWQAWKAEGTPDSVDIDLPDIGGVRITGRVGQVWLDAVRRLRTGKLKTKYRMRYWIDYLAVVATGRDDPLQIAGFTPKPKSMAFARFGGQIDATSARAELANLVRLYIEGQARPLHYHPDLADDYEEKGFDGVAGRFKSAVYESQRHHLNNDINFAMLLGDDDAPLGDNEQDSPFIQAITTVTQSMNATIRPIDENTEA